MQILALAFHGRKFGNTVFSPPYSAESDTIVPLRFALPEEQNMR